MILLALLASAGVSLAGHWLPEAPVELDPGEPWLLEQSGGSRRLLSLTPAEVHVEAWSEGVRVPLQVGPGDTLLIPAAATSRTLEITVSSQAEARWWRETDEGESARWDDYTAELARWAEHGGPIPEAPRDIPGLRLQWEARRAAMEALYELDPALLVQAAVLELDTIRTISPPSHATRTVQSVTLEAGGTAELEIEGPGRISLITRAAIGAQPYRRYGIRSGLSHEPLVLREFFTTEATAPDEETGLEAATGWGWPRTAQLTIPAGRHRLRLELPAGEGPEEAGPVELEVELARRRPSIDLARHSFPHLSPLGPRRPTEGPVGQLETAHLTGVGDVVSLAKALLETKAQPLAVARLIEHLPDGAEARAVWDAYPPTSLSAYALARRWIERGDVDPSVLILHAQLLPDDPELLAALADGLPWGFLRPRGRAIRMLAGLERPAIDDTRWTQLRPAHGVVRQRIEGTGGGIQRVGLDAGDSVDVVLPEPAREGRFPVLRLQADLDTRYRVDGVLHEGRGQLDEALAPGLHTVSVEQGRLWVMDAHLAVGGKPYRDKAAGPLPNRWVLPDPGAPGEIEVIAWGRPGSIFVATDDGATHELRLREQPGGAAMVNTSLPVGAHARELVIEGDVATLAAVALRRNNVEPEPELPSPWPDPLATLSDASRAMLSTRDPHQLARYRLERATAKAALGLVASSQREAQSVAATPSATPELRAQGKAIYRSTSPPVLTSDVPGPTTVDAALAMAGRHAERFAGCAELSAVAAALTPPLSWPVHREAAECLLADGDVVSAWREASAAGDQGRIARLRIASAGDWVPITRMDRNGGTVSIGKGRTGPDSADGVYELVQELSLGAPWQVHEYSVLRRRSADTLRLEGEGELALELLCKDEADAVEPEPCQFPVVIDGARRMVEVPESTIVRVVEALPPGAHSVSIGPVLQQGRALVVRSQLDGELIPPQAEFTAHLVGHTGAMVTVAGESLVRVRLQRGGPLTVSDGREQHQVEDWIILALEGEAPRSIAIDGPHDAAFTVTRLIPCDWVEPALPPLPPQLETNTPDPIAEAATARWMREAAQRGRAPIEPIGSAGTLTAWGDTGDDASGIRDTVQHYPFLGAGAGWYQRLDGTEHWFRASAYGRLGIGGVPGAHMDGAWAWGPGAGLLSVAASLAGSGGTGHAKLESRYRHRLPLGPWWTLHPFASIHAGWYGASSVRVVDPLAWTEWAARHWAGYGLGSYLDWRPLRDGRVRLVADLDSNADWTLDRARFELRTDTMILPHAVLRLGPELGYRFQDADRDQAYWRFALRGGLGYGGYTDGGARWTMGAHLDWLPLEQFVEGGLKFAWEWSHRRGLRDHPPYDTVFSQAFDLPLDG
jgi:hypothetical protein